MKSPMAPTLSPTSSLAMVPLKVKLAAAGESIAGDRHVIDIPAFVGVTGGFEIKLNADGASGVGAEIESGVGPAAVGSVRMPGMR